MSDVGRDASGDIAIIGLGCRLPGANGSTAATPDAFWEVLRDEVDLLREVPQVEQRVSRKGCIMLTKTSR